MRTLKLLCLFFLLALAACNRTPETLDGAAYERWVNSVEHGYIKQKEVNHVELSARYVPGQYLAYRDLKSYPTASYDSILNNYKCGLTFQFSLRADKSNAAYSQLKYYNISSQQEFMQRVQELSFNNAGFFELTYNSKNYQSAMCVFEGFDDLDNKLNFVVVFEVPEYGCGVNVSDDVNVTFTFDDPFWDLGVNHFEFDAPIFKDKPQLQL